MQWAMGVIVVSRSGFSQHEDFRHTPSGQGLPREIRPSMRSPAKHNLLVWPGCGECLEAVKV